MLPVLFKKSTYIFICITGSLVNFNYFESDLQFFEFENNARDYVNCF